MRRITIAMLFAVLIAGCGSGDSAHPHGSDIDHSQSTDIVDGAVRESETLERTIEIGGVEIILDSNNGKEQRWVVLTEDPENYLRNYRAWSADKDIKKEVDAKIVKWIEGEADEINTLAMDTPTRSVYRLMGNKYYGGAKIRIVYMGKLK